MKILTFTGSLSAAIVLVTNPGLIFAQDTRSASEIKKEIHIKIVENGVVTKDTVYTSSGESAEFEHIREMEMHHPHMDKTHMTEKQVTVMTSDGNEESRIVHEGGREKEVRVIVRDGAGNDGMPPVEEIWIGGPQDGRPCHTIIIHEGNCPGGEMKEGMGPDHGNLMPPPPPPPPHAAGSNVKVEKKVIKTDGGEKVIVVETTVDEQPKAKGQKKK